MVSGEAEALEKGLRRLGEALWLLPEYPPLLQLHKTSGLDACSSHQPCATCAWEGYAHSVYCPSRVVRFVHRVRAHARTRTHTTEVMHVQQLSEFRDWCFWCFCGNNLRAYPAHTHLCCSSHWLWHPLGHAHYTTRPLIYGRSPKSSEALNRRKTQGLPTPPFATPNTAAPPLTRHRRLKKTANPQTNRAGPPIKFMRGSLESDGLML